MSTAALLCLVAGNLCFAVWSHRTLGKALKATQESIVLLVTGKVREIGPVEAQQKALAKQAADRAIARQHRSAALNL